MERRKSIRKRDLFSPFSALKRETGIKEKQDLNFHIPISISWDLLHVKYPPRPILPPTFFLKGIFATCPQKKCFWGEVFYSQYVDQAEQKKSLVFFLKYFFAPERKGKKSQKQKEAISGEGIQVEFHCSGQIVEVGCVVVIPTGTLEGALFLKGLEGFQC